MPFRMSRFVFAGIAMLLTHGLVMFAASTIPAEALERATWLPYLTALHMGGAAVLIAMRRYPMAPVMRRAVVLVAAFPLGVSAWMFAARAVWDKAILYGLISLALTLWPWLPETEDTESPDLGLLVLGLAQGLVGGAMFLAPGSFSAPYYQSLQPVLPLAGITGLIGGGALILTQLRPALPRRRLIELAGAALPLILLTRALQAPQLTGPAWWAWAVLILVPAHWIGVPLRQSPRGLDPTSDEARLRVQERLMETWNWMLICLVVLLSAHAEPELLVDSDRVRTFAVGLVAYNVLAHMVFPHTGRLAHRLLLHIGVLSLFVGFLKTSGGLLGTKLLTLLAITAPLATHVAGRMAGGIVLGLALLVVLWVHGLDYAAGQLSRQAAALSTLIHWMLLGACSSIGIAVVEAERQVRQDLRDSRAEVDRQVETLSLVGQIAHSVRSSLDLSEVLHKSVTQLGGALEVDRCFLRLLDEDGSMPVVSEFVAPGAVSVTSHGPLPPSLIIATAKGSVIPDVRRVHTENPAEERQKDVLLSLGTRASMAAPIVVDGKAIGLIAVHDCQGPRAWQPHQVQLLEQVGTQAGVAIALAKSHQALLRRYRELEETARALNHSEERFRGAFESAPIGMVIMDTSRRYVQVNQALCHMLGYTELELLGRTLDSLVLTDDRKTCKRQFAALAAGAMPVLRAEMRLRHKQGHEVWVFQSISQARWSDGSSHFIGQMQDISERKRYETNLLHMANHDPLTGLFNRRRFIEEVEEFLALSRSFNVQGALCFLDLDHFKYINDTMGHRAGDELLCRVTRVLRERLRETDVIARLGGDEFAMLLPYTREEAISLAGQIVEALRQPGMADGSFGPTVTGSIGITFFPAPGATAEDLLAQADVAMYRAKEQGRDTFAVYADDMGWREEMNA
ncbi:MAG TPA: diguanylate cyclase, partial [Symbiobacteriaceae bacterium]|nr:diguanylate cyclase [Symbiobacteriaceae bacterium]